MDRTRERVHRIVVSWMREVLKTTGWSARQWAERAGVEQSSITRIIHPPEGEEPHIPTSLNVFKLAQACGSQPDWVKGNRRQATFVPAGQQQPAARRKAG